MYKITKADIILLGVVAIFFIAELLASCEIYFTKF